MKTTAYLAVSLDGYIADPEGGVDWLMDVPNPEQSDFGFAEFLSTIDALLMGRATFEVVQSFGEWPYTIPVYVLSRQLKEIPEGYENRIRLIQGTVSEALATITKEVGERIYVDGGQVVRSCLAEGCLSRLVLTTMPVILGRGISLFEPADHRFSLQHESTDVLGAGLVKTTYTVQADT